jgi:hypothetical protein
MQLFKVACVLMCAMLELVPLIDSTARSVEFLTEHQ